MGFSSYFFVEVEGVIVSSSKSEVAGQPYGGAKPGGAVMYDGGFRKVSSVRYNYIVNAKKYSGSLDSFWILNNSKEAYWAGRRIRVYYAPFNPKIAVLNRGPDILLLLLASTFLVGYFIVKSLFKEKIENV